MSFVDLMANDDWSEADIANRTEAMLRSQFSVVDEQVLNRKVTGNMLGIYVLDDDDKTEVAAFAAATLAARDAGVQARADMALLRETWALEIAQRRLAQPPVEPEVDDEGKVTNQEAVDTDTAERAQAQVVWDAGSDAAKALYERRNPPPPPEPEPEVDVLLEFAGEE
jgi:hypothetical protein